MPVPEQRPESSSRCLPAGEEIGQRQVDLRKLRESFNLKRTLLFLFVGVTGAMLAALPAASQVNPEAAPGPAQAAPYKYEAYVGVAYTRLRQVPVSFSGLLGGKAMVGRDFGKYFQLMASGDYYKIGLGHNDLPDRGNPYIYTFLVGPAVHATLYENLSGVFFAELGAEHTGNERETPNLSFAGGFGGGLGYSLGHNFGVQLTADRVAASFSLPNNNSQLSYSTNRTWNARATLGVTYKF